MTSSASVADPVLGENSITLSGGDTLTGVWSTITGSSESVLGGEQEMATAVLVVDAADGVDVSLVGQTGTYSGTNLRVSQVEKGEVFSSIFFVHDTETLHDL